MARRIAAVVFTLGCLHTGSASALGLGALTLDSFLNEPLEAKIDLLNTEGLSDQQIRIRLATSDDFDRMGIDRAYFLTSISFEIQVDDSGHGTIIVTSESPVLEPYLDFIVEARWPTGRLLREYTVLVDPPIFDANQTTTVSASQAIPSRELGATAKKKSQTQAGSGTTVKLGESQLARGQMPERNFGAEASSVPLPGDRYMIRRDETLWAIAKRSKPEGASINQTMLDIQRLNPKAFIGGNINRIKAGYIIYLPAASDISSADDASAVAEVNQQNSSWRDDVSSGRINARGGSLRISTTAQDEGTGSSGGSTGSSSGASNIANLESLESSEREREEVEGRLDAMSDQVDTLERIVSLKDDQIAALQKALAEAQSGTVDSEASTDTALIADADSTLLQESTSDTGEEIGAEPEREIDTESVADIEPSAAVTPPIETPEETVEDVKPTSSLPAASTKPSATKEEEGGIFSSLAVGIGGLVVLAIAIWAFVRRKAAKPEEEPAAEDVFADIQLEGENLEVVAEADAESAEVEEASAEGAEPEPVPSGSRGYGEGKNDEYAADIDSVDAIAEADIYIAYGRFSQAIDLLKTAIEGDTSNPVYKLKLMEVSEEVGDQAEVMKQFADIKALGDAQSLAEANAILGKGDSSEAASSPAIVSEDNPLDLSDDLDLDLPDMSTEGNSADINLEDEFGELEIEGFGSELTEDDLDLSKDFEEQTSASASVSGGEDMVFAADGDPVSTKLDLARAYLDMGDPDGARLIFEEVAVEGTAEQKQEAQALLDSLG